MKIDLNADVGEGFEDAPLYELVSSVNIACGAHAGDDETMRRACELAVQHGVSIGAHPGYPDRRTMGRGDTMLPIEQVGSLVSEQLERLARAAEGAGPIRHVKPHGALYNQAAADRDLAEAIVDAVGGLPVMGLAGSRLVEAARAAGLLAIEEGFADRRYQLDGSLVPRSQAGALIEAPDEAARQACAIAAGRPFEAADGTQIVVRAATICLHADTPGALENARAVRQALEAAGFEVAAP